MMLLRRLCLVMLLLACAVPAWAGPAWAGDVLHEHFTSPTLGRDWNYEVYLPTGYGETSRRYPVVYLLHGMSEDETSWVDFGHLDQTADRLITKGAIQPCIIVMPSAGRSWYVDGPEKIETAFIDDLLPEVDHHFHTQPDRMARVIGGLSMGGYGALHLALRHPDLFSAAALLSPAIYAPEPPPLSSARASPAFETNGAFDPALWRQMNYPGLLDDYAAVHLPLRMLLVAGLQDRLHTAEAAQAFAAAWQARGWDLQIHLQPGRHDFVLWRAVLPRVLRFLVGPAPMAVASTTRPVH